MSTLSQIQTLPGYRGSWDGRGSSKGSEQDVEKQLGGMQRSYQSGLLDVGKEIQRARIAGTRLPVHGEVINKEITKI